MELIMNIMPAGNYYVGDLCYVMHPEWNEVCDLAFPDKTHPNTEVVGVFHLKDGRSFANFSTANGDGEYTSNVGTSHMVDSGSIGCIRVSDIKDTTYADIETLGAIIEFKEPFEVGSFKGKIWFGNAIIDTEYIVDDFDYEGFDDEC
jgi:hypothetical protein